MKNEPWDALHLKEPTWKEMLTYKNEQGFTSVDNVRFYDF